MVILFTFHTGQRLNKNAVSGKCTVWFFGKYQPNVSMAYDKLEVLTMVTVKEIRELIYENLAINDIRGLGRMTDGEVLEAFANGFSDDGEMKINGVIYIPRGGSFKNYWHRVDGGTDDNYCEWVLELPDHENDGARIAIYPLRLTPDDYIVEIKYKDNSENDFFCGFEEAMEDVCDTMVELVNIW